MLCQLDCKPAHAAGGAKDQHLLPGLDVCLAEEILRRHGSLQQASSLFEIGIIGHLGHCFLGQGNVFSICAQVHASETEYLVSNGDTVNIFASSFDGSREFSAENGLFWVCGLKQCASGD